MTKSAILMIYSFISKDMNFDLCLHISKVYILVIALRGHKLGYKLVSLIYGKGTRVTRGTS